VTDAASTNRFDTYLYNHKLINSFIRRSRVNFTYNLLFQITITHFNLESRTYTSVIFLRIFLRQNMILTVDVTALLNYLLNRQSRLPCTDMFIFLPVKIEYRIRLFSTMYVSIGPLIWPISWLVHRWLYNMYMFLVGNCLIFLTINRWIEIRWSS
jgi:hypothetical protein